MFWSEFHLKVVFLLSSVSMDVSGNSGSKALLTDSHFSYYCLVGYYMTLIVLRYHSLEMHPVENKETNVLCLPIVSTSAFITSLNGDEGMINTNVPVPT